MNLLREFKDQFEVLYQSASEIAPDINSYEISLFLTKAVDKIVTDSIPSIDTNEASRQLLQPLVVTNKVSKSMQVVSEYADISKTKFYYDKEDRYNLRVNVVTNSCKGYIKVVTDKLDYIEETIANPFKRPNKRRVIKVMGGEDELGKFDFIYHSADVKITEITTTYVKDNNPIIVENFKDDPNCIGDETIKGKNTITNTELPISTYPLILELAVGFAKLTIKK